MLVICRDGILRIREHVFHPPKTHRYYDLPLRTYEKFYPNTFLKHLGHSFVLEDEITVRDYFANFAPYAELMEGLCAMDYQAYYEESLRTTQGEDHENLSHIDVKCYLMIRPVARFSRPLRREKDQDNQGPLRQIVRGDPIVTDRIEFEIQWDSSAVLHRAEYDENAGVSFNSVSVDWSPVSEWAHLPIRLSNRAILRDETGIYRDFLSVVDPILNPSHPWIEHQNGQSAQLDLIHTPSLRDLFEATFEQWGFSYSPVTRDEQMAEVAERVKEVKDYIETGTEPPDSDDDEVDERPEGLDVIVEIMSQDSASRVIPSPEDDD